jgi:hypothetical protein
MKLTIIPSDESVGINGTTISNLTLVGMPNNVHALQWEDSEGVIEHSDFTQSTLFSELPQWALDAVEVYGVAAEAAETEAAALVAETEAEPFVNLTHTEKLELVRQERNNRLTGSDWTQLSDSPVDGTTYLTYRQELRDFPETIDESNIDSLSWPVLPA